MDVNLHSVSFTVKHEATTTLVARVYRPQFFSQALLSGKIVVFFGVNDIENFAADMGIPAWKIRQEARQAAVKLVARITGMSELELENDCYGEGVGTVSVRPKKGFAFPAEAS